MMASRPRIGRLSGASALAVGFAAAAFLWQAPAVPPSNSYTPADDAELGRQAAAVIRQQLPLLRDGHVDVYLASMAGRLAQEIPTFLRREALTYGAEVLDLDELASFAVPGGPVFLSRGMIRLAGTESQLAGLIAHELAHVIMRHATAQAASGDQFQIGATSGRAIGAMLSGSTGGIIERAAQFSARSYFVAYDSAYERQADRLAVEIMAGAGYDPHELAVMIEAIGAAERTQPAGLRWTRNHPAPQYPKAGITRSGAIDRDAVQFDMEDAPAIVEGLDLIQMLLEEMPPAAGRGPVRSAAPPAGTVGYHVPVPSGESRSATAGDRLLLAVPMNWERLPAGNTVVFAPEGAFLRAADGPVAVTHGIQLGIARSLTGEFERDLEQLLTSFGRDNPYLTWTPAFQTVTLAGRRGLTTTLSNASRATGAFEYVSVAAAHLPDGSFFYVIGVAPQEDAGMYRSAFNRVLDSIRILD